MRRVLPLAGLLLVALLLGSWWVDTSLKHRLDAVDLSAATMARLTHPPGSPCARYGHPRPSAEALADTAAQLLALGITVDDLIHSYGHVEALESRREGALHGHTRAEEYLVAFEQAVAERPLERLLFNAQRHAVLRRIEEMLEVDDTAVASAAAFAELSPQQQAGLLALVHARPMHFERQAFFAMCIAAKREGASHPPAAP